MTHMTRSLSLSLLALTLAAAALTGCDVDLQGDDADASTLDDSLVLDDTHGFDTTPGADATVSVSPAARPAAAPRTALRRAARPAATVSAPFTVVLNMRPTAKQFVAQAWRRALPTVAATLTEDVERIALDALLESETAATPDVSAKVQTPLDTHWIAWLRHGEAVLAKAEASEPLGEGLDVSWIGGAPTFESPKAAHAVELSRPVVVDRLPAWIRALLGHPLRLVANSGEVCTATIDGFTLRSSYVFNPLADGYIDEDEAPAPADGEVLSAEDAWKKGVISLNATLAPTGGVCDNALLATDALQAAFPVAAKQALSRGLELRALRAFRATAKYAEEQAMHVESMRSYYPTHTPPIGRWEYHGGARPTSTRYVDSRDGREFVTVSADSYEACGGPGGGLTLLLEVIRRGNAAPTLVDRGVIYGTPGSLLDVNGDGRYETVNGGEAGGIYGASPKGYGEQLLDFGVPDYSMYGCPC